MEQELILRARAGDKAAFAHLTRRYLHRAHRVAYRYLGNSEDAADICQELFLRVYRSLPRFDAERPFYPWLYRILKNLCLNHLRMRSSARTVPLEESELPGRLPAPEGELLRREQVRGLYSALESLSAADREILMLKHFDGLRYAEIAATLQIPPGTVMSRLYNARCRLRRKLAALTDEDDLTDEDARSENPKNQPKARSTT